MYFISATRLRVRCIFFQPGFIKANEATVKELVNIIGFIKTQATLDFPAPKWTKLQRPLKPAIS